MIESVTTDYPPGDEHRHPTAIHGRFTLRSSFQPIYSFSHQRLVGHEALVRASEFDGSAVSPKALFDAHQEPEGRRALDRACAHLHAASFALQAEMPQWLFLNVDASTSIAQKGRADTDDWTLQLAGASGLHPSRIVLELLETALPSDAEAERWANELRLRGYLVALDDFGAGHSNFDRVFRIRPHIVKLDRSVTIHASTDRTVRAVMAQMISLLHECGALVLVEGVETSEEADIALDADADLVQGFRFGRPEPALRRLNDPVEAMQGVWARSSGRADADLEAYRHLVRPYVNALAQARDRLASGADMQAACSGFLSLEFADLCFLLDSDGVQIGGNAIRRFGDAAMEFAQFSPLSDVRGARWSRRPYFRRAVAAPGQVQLTRPYPTMHTRLMSVTLSLAFEMHGSTRVVCGDMLWHANVDRPVFGATVFDGGADC